MESESEERFVQTSPSVTKEKWFKHAMRKLAAGYVIIINQEHKNANFFKPGKGFEMCAYSTAKEMIRAGIIAEDRTTHRGVHYVLTDVSFLETERPLTAAPRREEKSGDVLQELEVDLDGLDDDLHEEEDA